MSTRALKVASDFLSWPYLDHLIVLFVPGITHPNIVVGLANHIDHQPVAKDMPVPAVHGERRSLEVGISNAC